MEPRVSAGRVVVGMNQVLKADAGVVRPLHVNSCENQMERRPTLRHRKPPNRLVCLLGQMRAANFTLGGVAEMDFGLRSS